MAHAGTDAVSNDTTISSNTPVLTSRQRSTHPSSPGKVATDASRHQETGSKKSPSSSASKRRPTGSSATSPTSVKQSTAPVGQRHHRLREQQSNETLRTQDPHRSHLAQSDNQLQGHHVSADFSTTDRVLSSEGSPSQEVQETHIQGHDSYGGTGRGGRAITQDYILHHQNSSDSSQSLSSQGQVTNIRCAEPLQTASAMSRQHDQNTPIPSIRATTSPTAANNRIFTAADENAARNCSPQKTDLEPSPIAFDSQMHEQASDKPEFNMTNPMLRAGMHPGQGATTTRPILQDHSQTESDRFEAYPRSPPRAHQEDTLTPYSLGPNSRQISKESLQSLNSTGDEDCEDQKYIHYNGMRQLYPVFIQDDEMERRVVRKLDWNLLPLLGVLYLFSFLDRVNIGNARLFGLEEGTHLSDGQYNIALAAFFLAYCAFEIPSNWVLVRIGPRLWIPILMVAWGSISLALAWVTSFTGLLIARFALGSAEAGFVPGVLFYLTLFYKRSEHSLRIAIFLSFNILAGAFGGLLAAAIANLTGVWGLQGWQWIFIIESVPTIILGGITWCVLTPSPASARFLTREERAYAANRILVDCEVRPTAEASWRQIRSALTDKYVITLCISGLFLYMPNAGVVLFMPSLIADMGFKATTAQLLTVPPYTVAVIMSLVFPWWSDRIRIRGLFVICLPILSLAGFLILALAEHVWVRYTAVILAMAGMVPSSSILVSWLTNNCVSHTKRATALAMLVSSSGLGAMIGSQVYRTSDAPRYRSIAIAILTSFMLRAILSSENRRRDRSVTSELNLMRSMSDAQINDLGDRHPHFRYTL